MIALEDGVGLWAPGGAHVPGARTLVLADPHAGYVATLRRRGHALPETGEELELHGRVRGLLAATGAERVVVAGDLVHGRGALARRGSARSALEAFLAVIAPRELVVVAGNHDAAAAPWLAARGVPVAEAVPVGAHVVMHGDEDPARLRRARAAARGRGGRLILGHHHPALTLDDGAGARARVPVFAHAPGLLCLPALAPLARGADLRRADYGAELAAVVPAGELALAAVVGRRVIPVGLLSRIRAAR